MQRAATRALDPGEPLEPPLDGRARRARQSRDRHPILADRVAGSCRQHDPEGRLGTRHRAGADR